MSTWEEMRQVVLAAKRVMEAADGVACEIAPLIAGRLRRIDAETAAQLKRELRDFNIHTRTWK